MWVTRKGGKRQALALPPPAADRVDSYLAARVILSEQAVQTAFSQLIGLSNSNDGAENRERLKEIRSQLQVN